MLGVHKDVWCHQNMKTQAKMMAMSGFCSSMMYTRRIYIGQFLPTLDGSLVVSSVVPLVFFSLASYFYFYVSHILLNYYI